MFFFHLGISITVFEIAAPLLHNNVFFCILFGGVLPAYCPGAQDLLVYVALQWPDTETSLWFL